MYCVTAIAVQTNSIPVTNWFQHDCSEECISHAHIYALKQDVVRILQVSNILVHPL